MNVSSEPRRLALSVTKDALRQIRAGHPWVFDGSITRIKAPSGSSIDDARPGDLAVIFDTDRKFVAIGLYDPTSPIRVRILHRGAPRQIDAAFFEERITIAAQTRLDAFDDPDTSGFRLVHGENDGLPGLVIDRYADTVVIKLYSTAWLVHLDPVVATVKALVAGRPSGLRSVVLRLSRSVAATADNSVIGDSAIGDSVIGDSAMRAGAALVDGSALFGPHPEGPVLFRENGLRFEADVIRGHKTGFFLDQRDNRRLIRSISRGVDVLDVFSFSGGFSVSAAAGGANSVLSVDINPWAIKATERNLALNRRIGNVRHCNHSSSVGDARDVLHGLQREHRRFGLVVVDPPSFASSRRQVPMALRSYGELTKVACALTEPGGTLFQSSCSAQVDRIDFRQVVIESAHRAGYALSDVRETGQPIDHPIGFAQGEYLKGLLATVRRRH